MAQNLIQVACVLSKEQYRALKRLSKARHTPMTIFLREAVTRWLEVEQPRKSPPSAPTPEKEQRT